MPQPAFGHAVVAGGGMVDLLAARVLSEHFERVTVVERDRLATRPEQVKHGGENTRKPKMTTRNLFCSPSFHEIWEVNSTGGSRSDTMCARW